MSMWRLDRRSECRATAGILAGAVGIVVLLVSGCGSQDTRVRLGVTIGPTTVGDGLAFRVEVSQWDLFGVRLRGCGGAGSLDPVPWTVGFLGAQPLTCEPKEDRPCTARGADLSCCDRERLPFDVPLDDAAEPESQAGWCGLDVVPDRYGEVEASGRASGALVIQGSVEETGGTMDAWLDIPPLGLELTESFVQIRSSTGGRRPFAIPHALVVEVGSGAWLQSIDAKLASGAQVVVRPGDAIHDTVVRDMLDAVRLVVDLDNDGFVDPEEREAETSWRLTEL